MPVPNICIKYDEGHVRCNGSTIKHFAKRIWFRILDRGEGLIFVLASRRMGFRGTETLRPRQIHGQPQEWALGRMSI